MRRVVVLGCTLLIVAACGGGDGRSVENAMQVGPQETETSPMEPAMTPSLSTLGAYETVPVGDVGDGSTAVFHRWGIWGGILRYDAVTCTAIGCPPAGDTNFMAYLNHESDGTVSRATQGTRSGTSPVGGSAVWTGDVAAFETTDVMTSDGTSVSAYAPVEGSARLQVDFAAATVDARFADFDNGRADLSWDGLVMRSGEFGNGIAGIEGAFYGVDHVGVAGTFARDGLAGVFGALRSSK